MTGFPILILVVGRDDGRTGMAGISVKTEGRQISYAFKGLRHSFALDLEGYGVNVVLIRIPHVPPSLIQL